ncbi:118_t:CDS:2 [Paraglomus occultum]|uniref:118_t:CDS:1 n=1 Tax=Paraglomus occultum TaxID=144539 RepID=A0A9N9CDC3_9GLOM|nr:118_t:CDS:2 [Paraglomus occultum]
MVQIFAGTSYVRYANDGDAFREIRLRIVEVILFRTLGGGTTLSNQYLKAKTASQTKLAGQTYGDYGNSGENNEDSIPATDDQHEYLTGNISAIGKTLYHGHSLFNSSDDISSGRRFGFILNQTNFYAEADDIGSIIISGRIESVAKYTVVD